MRIIMDSRKEILTNCIGKEEVFDTKDFTISIFEVMMKKIIAREISDLVMTYKE